MARVVTVRQGTISACGPMVSRRADGTVCVLVKDGDIFCGKPVNSLTVTPVTVSASGHAVRSKS